MHPVAVVLVAVASAAVLGADVPLATFDGAPGTSFSFVEQEDTVMGSESWGNWTQSTGKHGFGTLSGVVTRVDRPAVSIVGASPGFIKTGASGQFPDATSAAGGGLLLTVRSSTPSFEGFRVSFASGAKFPEYSCKGGGHVPLSRGCYKARFSVPPGDSFTQVRIAFNTFSDMWSPATGNATVACNPQSDPQRVCPGQRELGAIQRIEIGAEGINGKVHLDVLSVAADLDSGALVEPLSH